MRRTALRFLVVVGAISSGLCTAFAQTPGRGPGQGPVITQCKGDIAKHCAGKSHDGEVRACLESKKAEVTQACKTALESTGGGKGRK